MSESLSITTVAEGIEEESQADRMRALGCTYGQGYFFARPVRPEEVPAIIGRQAAGDVGGAVPAGRAGGARGRAARRAAAATGDIGRREPRLRPDARAPRSQG